MYRCDGQGYLTGWSGKRYKITPGKTLDLPNGELWNRSAVQWIGDEPEQMPEFDTGRETIYPDKMKSTDYTVKKVRKFAKDMSRERLKKFIEGDNRKTVKRLL